MYWIPEALWIKLGIPCSLAFPLLVLKMTMDNDASLKVEKSEANFYKIGCDLA